MLLHHSDVVVIVIAPIARSSEGVRARARVYAWVGVCVWWGVLSLPIDSLSRLIQCAVGSRKTVGYL